MKEVVWNFKKDIEQFLTECLPDIMKKELEKDIYKDIIEKHIAKELEIKLSEVKKEMNE